MSFVYWRRSQRFKRRAFGRWIAAIRNEDMKQKQELLSQIVTETTYKQRVFLAFKHAMRQER